jgi:hypothetical protein
MSSKQLSTLELLQQKPILISDKRCQKDFSKITFSKYKKTDVKKQLLLSVLQNKLENANYWCAEYICAGHYLELWDIIITIMSKHIHRGNPRLPVYIVMRLNDFRSIVTKGFRDNELQMRNDYKIRMLFCEIISLLCFSHRKHSFTDVKVPLKEFQLNELSYRLKADSLEYANEVWKKKDPKECFIAVNEFIYALKQGYIMEMDACYWYEWLMSYENILKKKKDKCICDRRDFPMVESKFQNEIVWILWEAMLNISIEKGKLCEKIVDSLFNLYCLRFSQGVKRKRRFIIYFTISLLVNNIDDRLHISQNPEGLEIIKTKLNKIYEKIKKNEVKPKTDYLYHGLEKDVMADTLNKLDLMSSISLNMGDNQDIETNENIILDNNE